MEAGQIHIPRSIPTSLHRLNGRKIKLDLKINECGVTCMILPINFEGFIAPEGELVSIEDVDRILSVLTKHTENIHEIVQSLWAFAGECSQAGYFNAAIGYYEKIFLLVDKPGEKAECLLAMGQVWERAGDYQSALDVYSRAFELPQKPDIVWYFLHNNSAFCQNLEGRHQEAEVHCRAAIEIDPDRFNARKNLALAVQGMGRYAEAAKSFVDAIMACPGDHRALGHLEDLIAAYPDILEQEPGLLEQLRKCYAAVKSIRGKTRIQ